MHTEGLFAPESEAAVSEQYAAAGAAAEVVVSELVRALPVADEAADRPDDATLQLTATEAIFASLLEVRVGTDDEFEAYEAETDRNVEMLGSEHVSGVAWHDAPAADRILAATYENEPEAAVDALRRQAFVKLYREVV
jgi:hypothetical protein